MFRRLMSLVPVGAVVKVWLPPEPEEDEVPIFEVELPDLEIWRLLLA